MGRSANNQVISRPGMDALWEWFGLSYASWLVLPRCLMHEMPDEWQAAMAALLQEFTNTFEDDSGVSYYVSAKRNGKFVPMPDWASRQFYRHPIASVIESLRRKCAKGNQP